MSEIRKLFKLLLNKEFYDKHKHKIPVNSFDEIGQELLETVEVAHSTYKRDLSTEDVFLTYIALNPVLTTANKNTIEVYLENVKYETDISRDVAEVVYQTLWRKEVGRYISEYGINLSDGDITDLSDLSSYIDRTSTTFIPQDFGMHVDTDPINLFNRLNQRGKWKINIPSLNIKIDSISPGQFIVILARPECGKTATIVNLLAGKEGFAAQGANAHLIANEEGADATAGRAICCFNEKSFREAKQNPNIVNTKEWQEVRKKLHFLHQPEVTLSQLDAYCRIHKPDILVIDQLDHVGVLGNFEKGHERLGMVYRKARELASKWDMVVIGVSQASAEAENHTRVNFSMAEGSRTAKGAAADLIIGIGKADEGATEEGNEVLRHYTVSKNKINGFHGTVICKLLQDQSRLVP